MATDPDKPATAPAADVEHVRADDSAAADPVMGSEKGMAQWDEAAQRRLLWKCDRHVLPCIALLYFMSFLDRTNIGGCPVLC